MRGITVRSRSVIGNIGAGIQSLFGGNITIYTELAEKARAEAFDLMVERRGRHASSARQRNSADRIQVRLRTRQRTDQPTAGCTGGARPTSTTIAGRSDTSERAPDAQTWLAVPQQRLHLGHVPARSR